MNGVIAFWKWLRDYIVPISHIRPVFIILRYLFPIERVLLQRIWHSKIREFTTMGLLITWWANQQGYKINIKNYYNQNRDKILEYKREYQKNNKDKLNAYHQQYNKKNRDRVRKWQRDFYYRKKEITSKSPKNLGLFFVCYFPREAF